MEPCHVCNDLQNLPSYKEVLFEDIIESRALGCSACSMLSRGIQSYLDESSTTSIDSILLHGRASSLPAIEPRPLIVQVNKADNTNVRLEFYRKPGAYFGWTDVGIGREVSSHSSTNTCFLLARRWLQECINNHTQCPGMRLSPLPTRVLELDIRGSEVRLFESLGEKALYATLSHRWGSTVPLRLTTATMDSLRRGITTSSLPKTFRDAVTIVQRLDLRYLWIDSLCIIQDDALDWAKESRQMSSIYTNSTLTIAADCASDCHSGCFSPRSVLDTYSVEAPAAEGAESSFSVRHERTKPYPQANCSTSAGARRSGLHSRAWVFQERLLASRTLHYTGTELAWECATGIACECRVGFDESIRHLAFKRAFVHPDLDSYGYFYRSLEAVSPSYAARIDKAQRVIVQLDQRKSEVSIAVQRHWELVVFEYTARGLTVDLDRLPALSGIADAISQQTSKEYLFGLWSDEIVRGLLWYSADKYGQSVSHRLQKGYAPTWSWASVTGRIRHHPEEDHLSFYPKIEVHKTTRHLSSSNIYGPGTGTITVSGWLVPVFVQPTKSAPDGSPRRFVTDRELQTSNGPGTSLAIQPRGSFDPDVKGKEDGICIEQDHFFLICAIASRGKLEDGWILGLMLTERAPKTVPSSYVRVGFVLGNRSFSLKQWEEKGTVRVINLV